MIQTLIKNVHCNKIPSNERFFRGIRSALSLAADNHKERVPSRHALPSLIHNCYLLLANFHITDSDRTTVVVDTPAIFLDTVDALCVADITIDIHYQHRIISVDVYIVGVVSGASNQ